MNKAVLCKKNGFYIHNRIKNTLQSYQNDRIRENFGQKKGQIVKTQSTSELKYLTLISEL